MCVFVHLIVYYVGLFSVHYMPKVCILRQKTRQIPFGQLGIEGKKKQIAITTHCWFYRPSPFIHCPTFSIFVKHCQKISSVSGGHLIKWKCAPWQRVQVFWTPKCLLHHVSLTWAFLSSFFPWYLEDTLCVLERFFN